MVYHKVTLGPTEGQMDDLSHGTEVKLSNEHFHGEVPFELTTAQVKKISKAAASGKGCTLKLSAAQIKHHAMHGSGRFADIIATGYKYLKPVLKMGLSKGLDYGRDLAEKKISNMAGLDSQHGGSFLGDAGRWLGHTIVDGGVDLLGGKIKPKRAPKKAQHGGSFLGDAGRWLGHAAVDGGVDLLGGSVAPSQLANNNEKLSAALFQKKVSGRGLYQ